MVEAFDVEVLRVWAGDADGGVGECADAGEDVNDSGQHVGSDTGLLAVLVPAIFKVGLGEVFGELVEVGAGGIGGEVVTVKDDFGVGDAGKEAADGEAIATHDGALVADDFGEVEAVGLEEGAAEEGSGDVEADVAEVRRGSEAALADLVDVEGELGADVGVLAFVVGDDGAVLLFELGELDGDGLVDGLGVADGVADVMRESADGEGQFVGSFGIVNEAEDEVAGADVVGEVAEERITEGIVAEVLNGATAVGVGVGLVELGFGHVGEALEEQGADGFLPGQVDELLVGLDGVAATDMGEGEQDESKQEGFAEMGRCYLLLEHS